MKKKEEKKKEQRQSSNVWNPKIRKNKLNNYYCFCTDKTSLKQENTILRNQTLCVICMEETVSIVFLPCGHLACCEECAPAIKKCPICRKFVRGTVKTKASWCLYTFNLSSNVSLIIFVFMDIVWKPVKCIIWLYSKNIAKFHLSLKLLRTMYRLRNETWHLRDYFRFGWISQSY